MTRQISHLSKQDWCTPKELFLQFQAEFNLNTDLAASSYNALLPNWVGEGTDALSVAWPSGTRGYWNPPYFDIRAWASHALRCTAAGAFSVGLVPASTDTHWFHEFCAPAQVDFFRGRIAFEDHTPVEVDADRLGRCVSEGKRPSRGELERLGRKNLLGENPAATALLDKTLVDWRKLVAKKDPGPGFPSMLVIFDPDAPAHQRQWRCRDNVTGKLL